MLSRTADHLYWMARYTERAENLARLLDVSYQMSMVPQSVAVHERELARHTCPEQPGGGFCGGLRRGQCRERPALHGRRPGQSFVDLTVACALRAKTRMPYAAR
jgi:hypothetical protein